MFILIFLLQDIKVSRDSVNGHAAFDKGTHSTTDSHRGGVRFCLDVKEKIKPKSCTKILV